MKADSFEHTAIEQIDALYGYALRLSRHSEQAEDLVQETFVRAIPYAPKIKNASGVRPVLFRILHNLFIDQYRSRQRGPMLISTDGLEEDLGVDSLSFIVDADNPRDLLLDGELSDEIETALAELDDAWRETIWLREIEGFSYDEISQITEVPVGTVRSRLSRARRALADHLEEFARSEYGLGKKSKLKEGSR